MLRLPHLPRGIHHPPPHTGIPINLYIGIKDNRNTQRVDESNTESKPVPNSLVLNKNF